MFARYLPLIALCSAGALFLDTPFSHSDGDRAVSVPSQSAPAPELDTVPPVEQEEEYVEDVRDWLNSLPKNKQARARQIMREAHTELTNLRAAIREKKTQLARLSFGPGTAPDTLPRLGLELQGLRNALDMRLQALKQKLADEVAIDMGKLHKNSFWLPLPLDYPLN